MDANNKRFLDRYSDIESCTEEMMKDLNEATRRKYEFLMFAANHANLDELSMNILIEAIDDFYELVAVGGRLNES